MTTDFQQAPLQNRALRTFLNHLNSCLFYFEQSAIDQKSEIFQVYQVFLPNPCSPHVFLLKTNNKNVIKTNLNTKCYRHRLHTFDIVYIV